MKPADIVEFDFSSSAWAKISSALGCGEDEPELRMLLLLPAWNYLATQSLDRRTSLDRQDKWRNISKTARKLTLQLESTDEHIIGVEDFALLKGVLDRLIGTATQVEETINKTTTSSGYVAPKTEIDEPRRALVRACLRIFEKQTGARATGYMDKVKGAGGGAAFHYLRAIVDCVMEKRPADKTIVNWIEENSLT